MKRLKIIGILVTVGILFMLVTPVAFATASDNQVLSILVNVIEGIIKAGRDGYCAMGVEVFCQ